MKKAKFLLMIFIVAMMTNFSSCVFHGPSKGHHGAPKAPHSNNGHHDNNGHHKK
jgi:hypothetical protein